MSLDRITSHIRAVRPLAVLLAICCCLSVVRARRLNTAPQSAASSRPCFSPSDVVGQVDSARSNPTTTELSNSFLSDGEFLIDTSVTLVSAPYNQSEPSVAFDGVNFLVVWCDQRGGFYGYDIYGARVTPQGTVLDPTGFAICRLGGDQRIPAVGFDGANFLVAWADERGGDWDIYGARVTPQGTVLDSTGICISRASDAQVSPAVGFDGASFLVVWEDFRSGVESDIYGARVTSAGVVLDPSGISISTAVDWQGSPSLAFDGTNFLVVWEDERSGSDNDIYGARVTQQGTVLDPAGFIISQAASEQYDPTLCLGGANLLVAWEDWRGDPCEIYAARVTPQGGVLDSAGIPISPSAYDQYSPSLAFDGADFLAVWEDWRSNDGDIYGARVTPGGTVFDGGSVVNQQGNQSCPRLYCGIGGQMLLLYQGWVGTIDDRVFNTNRIWGKMDPNPAITELTKPEVRITDGRATIIHGMMFQQEAAGHKRQAASLLDATGRKVMELRAGANDVRALAPGVYFVREAQAQAQAQAVRKVVVTR